MIIQVLFWALNIVFKAISRQRPTTNIKSDMVCVKLIDITEWMLIKLWYIDTIVMLTFIPWVLLVLQKK